MIHSFLSRVTEDECVALINEMNGVERSQRGRITLYRERISLPRRMIVDRLVTAALVEARQFYLDADLVPETVLLARLVTGEDMPKHADNVKLDGTPNHTPKRHTAAIYYLNENFDGGEIVFDHFNVSIKPKEGQLLIFPCDLDHAHSVTMVTRGDRYSLAIWMVKGNAAVF